MLGVKWEHMKILEDRIVGEDIEEIIEMKTIPEKEVGVGLEKGNVHWVIIVGMTEP